MFRPAKAAAGKLSKDGRGHLSLVLQPTVDILAGLAAGRRPAQTVVGFAAEHGPGSDGRGEATRKQVDAIVLVNDVSTPGIGFDSPENEATIVTAAGDQAVARGGQAGRRPDGPRGGRPAAWSVSTEPGHRWYARMTASPRLRTGPRWLHREVGARPLFYVNSGHIAPKRHAQQRPPDRDRTAPRPRAGIDVLLVEQSGDVLRVCIHHPDGVTLGLCEQVTRELTDLRDRYALEVSSPGPRWPLTKPEHFRRFVGRRARVRTAERVRRAANRNLTGELVAAPPADL